jgi:hypothetical protein
MYIYNIRCIPYSNIHHDKSNGVDLVFEVFIFFYYILKFYVI